MLKISVTLLPSLLISWPPDLLLFSPATKDTGKQRHTQLIVLPCYFVSVFFFLFVQGLLAIHREGHKTNPSFKWNVFSYRSGAFHAAWQCFCFLFLVPSHILLSPGSKLSCLLQALWAWTSSSSSSDSRVLWGLFYFCEWEKLLFQYSQYFQPFSTLLL